MKRKQGVAQAQEQGLDGQTRLVAQSQFDLQATAGSGRHDAADSGEWHDEEMNMNEGTVRLHLVPDAL